MDRHTSELVDGRWRVVNSVGQVIITVENAALNPGETGEVLADMLASFVNQVLMWSDNA